MTNETSEYNAGKIMRAEGNAWHPATRQQAIDMAMQFFPNLQNGWYSFHGFMVQFKDGQAVERPT